MTENTPAPAELDVQCSNPECPLAQAHSGPCAPKGWRAEQPATPTSGMRAGKHFRDAGYGDVQPPVNPCRIAMAAYREFPGKDVS